MAIFQDLSLLAFPLILFSAFTHAVYNALIKRASDKLVARMLMALSSTIFIGPLAFYVPLPSPSLFALLCFTAVVHFLYQMAQIKSLHYADYTLAYPVARGTAPLFIAAFSPFIFHDQISFNQLLGIIIISTSILSMGFSAPKGNGLGILFSLITGVAIAAYTSIDAKGVRLADTPATYIVWFFIFDSIVISTFTLSGHWKRFLGVVATEWKLGATNGLLGICTFGSAMLAFKFGNAPVMAALRETSVLFAAFIGYLFLGERFNRIRIISIIGIGIGVAVIRLA